MLSFLNDPFWRIGLAKFVYYQERHPLAVSTSYQAELTLQGFEKARLWIPALKRYSTFSDWCDEREGKLIGLNYAGVNMSVVRLSFDGFLDWIQAGGRKPNLKNLDEFAAFVAKYRDMPNLPCGGYCNTEQYKIYHESIDEIKDYLCYQNWDKNQIANKNRCKNGHQVLLISAHRFIKWAQCLSIDTNEANLEIYTNLWLETVAQVP